MDVEWVVSERIVSPGSGERECVWVRVVISRIIKGPKSCIIFTFCFEFNTMKTMQTRRKITQFQSHSINKLLFK